MDIEQQIAEVLDSAREQALALVREWRARLAGFLAEGGGTSLVPTKARGRKAAKLARRPSAVVGSKVAATLKAKNKCPVCGKRGKGPRFGFHCDEHKVQFLSRKAVGASQAAAESQAAGVPPAEGDAAATLPAGFPKPKGRGKRRRRAKK